MGKSEIDLVLAPDDQYTANMKDEERARVDRIRVARIKNPTLALCLWLPWRMRTTQLITRQTLKGIRSYWREKLNYKGRQEYDYQGR